MEHVALFKGAALICVYANLALQAYVGREFVGRPAAEVFLEDRNRHWLTRLRLCRLTGRRSLIALPHGTLELVPVPEQDLVAARLVLVPIRQSQPRPSDLEEQPLVA